MAIDQQVETHRSQMTFQVMHADERTSVQSGERPAGHGRHHQSAQPGQAPRWMQRHRWHPSPDRSASELVSMRPEEPPHDDATRFREPHPPAGVLFNLRRNPDARTVISPSRKTQHGGCGLVTTCFEGKHCCHRGQRLLYCPSVDILPFTRAPKTGIVPMRRLFAIVLSALLVFGFAPVAKADVAGLDALL